MDNADSKILLGMNKEKKSETTVNQKKKRPKTKTTNIKERTSNKSGNKSSRH